MYKDKRKNMFLSAGLSLIACLMCSTAGWAQTPTASPSGASSNDGMYGDYKITSSVEFGYRFLRVNGDREKYRSDLNYRAGVRVLDSSFLIEDIGGKHKFIDSALITMSGWGADPSGSATVKMNKSGVFKFDSNVRRVTYYNNLKNFNTMWSQPIATESQHKFNTTHYFGDFDLTLLPDNELIRVKLGYGFNNTTGPGNYTMRWPQFGSTTLTTRGDEFMVNVRNRNKSDDFRAGVEGNLAGFNWGVNYGRRMFRDNARFSIDSFSNGNNPLPNTAQINSFYRDFPTRGTTDYVSFNLQRTFAKVLDFTGRLVYSDSRTNFLQSDSGSGLSTFSGVTIPQVIIDLDQATVTGTAKRNQTRGDLGATYRITSAFRISDTFNFDQFRISGQNRFLEYLYSRTTAGVARPNDYSDNGAWRATNYRRYTNLIEADYQVSKQFAFNFGYRYSQRRVELGAFDRNLVTGIYGLVEDETFQNSTHTFIAGTKIKPTKYWSIWADVERGSTDTPFTRLSNGKFLNFRVKTRASAKNFVFGASFISKDNDTPGAANCNCNIPITETIANSKNRLFSANVDWSPISEFTLSSGYTYNKMDTEVDIIVPVGSPVLPGTTFFLGKSRYYMRDSYFFFDVTARPMKRVSLYASYRVNTDPGQGSIIGTVPQDIISSYPMTFHTPEVRLAVKLTKNIDWNLGYQYYSYTETPVNYLIPQIVITGQPNTSQRYPAQNYTAHLPYMSLRIYLGGDR